MLVGIIPEKPSRDSLRGLKGLLHALNAIVHPTKLDLSFCFLVYFQFCIAKGLTICKFEGLINVE
jgi:hypothetical protein